MNEIFLLCRSVTHAEHIGRVLKINAVPAEIVRPERKITESSCVYAVRVSETFFAEAMETLYKSRVLPQRVIFSAANGTIRELKI